MNSTLVNVHTKNNPIMAIQHLAKDASSIKTNNTSSEDNLLIDEHDAMVADLLVKKHGDNLIYDTSLKEWKVFCNGIWIEAEDAARKVLEYYYRIVLDISDHKYPQYQIGDAKWLKSVMNQNKASAVLKYVEILTAKGIKSMNADHNLIGIQDVVYEIDANTTRPARAKDLVFKSLGTHFDPSADCPQWKQFLYTAMQGDQEMIDYLQRLVGYFLTASTREQEIYYFYGTGANGKSTFIDLVKSLLGSYGVKVSSDSFMKKRSGTLNLGAQASLAMLAGARLAITDETNDGDSAFDAQTLKSISGDDEVTGRFLRQNPITFKSTAKLVMYGNDKPYGNINDEGFWRRFRFIHFGYVVPKEERDPALLHKLKDELPGILNWALDGLAAWNQNGLQTPQQIFDESLEYRSEIDSVTEFLNNIIVLDADQVIATKQLFDAYETWCRDNLKIPERMQGFSKRAALYFEHNPLVQPFRNSKTRGFKGITLS